jgi:mycothiol system anti-sigma-R factor
VAFFDSLKRLFGGTGQNGRSGDEAPFGGSGSPNVAMIPCAEASARLFEYLDGELEGVSEEEVRRHLEACEACYPRVQFEKHFREALQRSQEGGRVSESLRERVLQALAEDEGLD